jgi:hypothetical protein
MSPTRIDLLGTAPGLLFLTGCGRLSTPSAVVGSDGASEKGRVADHFVHPILRADCELPNVTTYEARVETRADDGLNEFFDGFPSF